MRPETHHTIVSIYSALLSSRDPALLTEVQIAHLARTALDATRELEIMLLSEGLIDESVFSSQAALVVPPGREPAE